MVLISGFPYYRSTASSDIEIRINAYQAIESRAIVPTDNHLIIRRLSSRSKVKTNGPYFRVPSRLEVESHGGARHC